MIGSEGRYREAPSELAAGALRLTTHEPDLDLSGRVDSSSHQRVRWVARSGSLSRIFHAQVDGHRIAHYDKIRVARGEAATQRRQEGRRRRADAHNVLYLRRRKRGHQNFPTQNSECARE